jgi:hypothetical protein
LPSYIKKYSKSLLNLTIGDDSETGGIVGEASKVSNALTLKLNGVAVTTYDGSEAQEFNVVTSNFIALPNNSYGTSGQVLKSSGTGVYWGTDNTGVSEARVK